MERAADASEAADPQPADPSLASPEQASSLPAAPAYHETPEPAAHELVAREAALGPHPAEAEIGKHLHPESPPGQPAP
jgi:hypothetical protein